MFADPKMQEALEKARAMRAKALARKEEMQKAKQQ